MHTRRLLIHTGLLACLMATASSLNAESPPFEGFRLSTDNSNYVVTPQFNQVAEFAFTLVIEGPLQSGLYDNPPIVSVDYQVTGSLPTATPSTFDNFALARSYDGEAFYTQGGSLAFTIAEDAVFSDGIQVAELVGEQVVLRLNAREEDTGRFHPALFELNADGTGRLQNSDNIPSAEPLVSVAAGAEYITDLMFDAGNTTLLTSIEPDSPGNGDEGGSGGGSGAASLPGALVLLLMAVARCRHKRCMHGSISVRT